MKNIKTPLSGPHTHSTNSVTKIMWLVLLALLPATLFGFYLFGWPAFNLWLITIATAIIAEAICLWAMSKPITPFITDGSAILSAWLLAMTLPPWAPWWIGVMGALIAIVIGKQIFGGIGQNIFNPAMLSRVALLIAFPVQMTSWVKPIPFFSRSAPDFIHGLSITLHGYSIDAVSGATSLGYVKTELSLGTKTLTDILSKTYNNDALTLGFVNGSMGETSAVLILLGGIFLIYKRIISWHIPVAMIGSVAILAFITNIISPERYPSMIFHITSGGLILGAFFIATDMVTSPNTKTGKLIFAAGCGGLVFVIRTWGGFPEGVAFAVMLMNSLVPLINHYIRPRVYGHTYSGNSLQYDASKLKAPDTGADA